MQCVPAGGPRPRMLFGAQKQRRGTLLFILLLLCCFCCCCCLLPYQYSILYCCSRVPARVRYSFFENARPLSKRRKGAAGKKLRRTAATHIRHDDLREEGSENHSSRNVLNLNSSSLCLRSLSHLHYCIPVILACTPIPPSSY